MRAIKLPNIKTQRQNHFSGSNCSLIKTRTERLSKMQKISNEISITVRKQQKLDQDYKSHRERQQEQDDGKLKQLDYWAQNIPKTRMKHSIKTQSIVFLYKQSDNRNISQKLEIFDSKHSQLGVFLANLDNKLNKIKNFDYQSIYKNIQYCSGLYENQFTQLIKKVDKYIKDIENKYTEGLKFVEESRKKHIQQIQNMTMSGITGNSRVNDKIRQESQKIEIIQSSLKPIKKLIRTLQNKRQSILKTALSLGYDVRQTGLAWILKQLKYIPKQLEFPSFLNQRQIKFIISKYQNQGNISTIEQQKENSNLQKSIANVYQNLNRKKRRQLSTIIESQLIKRMQSERLGSLGNLRKYINEETMRIIQKESSKVKATKQQLIYKQASRKIHQICADAIHGRRQLKKRSSIGTQKMEKQFNSMISNSLSFTKMQEQIKNNEQKQLYNIIKSLRMEKYSSEITQKSRSPITVMACLVGWKKAKRILQQQLSINL